MAKNKVPARLLRQGAPPKYETADALAHECLSYLEWVENNPLHEEKAFSVGGEIKKEKIGKMRAATMNSGITWAIKETWINWRKTRADLSEVIAHTEQLIYDQKFTGAAAGLLSTNIIARDLGLVEKQQTDHSGHIGIGELTDEALQARIQAHLDKAKP